MEQVRPSILNMRPRSANTISKCTQETAEEQYRREQELIAARGRRLQQSEQRLLSALYPTAEHVKARQHEIYMLQEKAVAAQAEARQREAALVAPFAYHTSHIDISNMRPWTACTLDYRSDDEERMARRKFTHELASDNLKLMTERARQRQQLVAQEVVNERENIASERQFWNLGATNARWIAPEYRHLAPSPPRSNTAMTETSRPPTAPSTVTPPWATYEDAFSSNNSSRRTSRTSIASAVWDAPVPAGNLVRRQPYPAGLDHPRPQKKHLQPAQQSIGRHPWEWDA